MLAERLLELTSCADGGTTLEYLLPHSLPLVLPEYLWIPERVAVEGDNLVWEWGEPELRLECGDVLGDFTRLAGGELDRPDRDAVLGFARQYGPLIARERPVGDDDIEAWREPIEVWRDQTQRVQAAAKLARLLGDGETVSRAHLDGFPDPGPFELLFFAQATDTDPARLLDQDGQRRLSRVEFEQYRKRQVRREEGKKAVPVLGHLEEDAKRWIRVCLDVLLHFGRAQVRLEWNDDERPRIALHGLGFSTVVAGQLLCAVYGGKLAVCDQCGAAITSGRKRPTGQRAFCDKTCRAASNKLDKRLERARARGRKTP